ncbi:HalOD1 output domain-containing protein [Haloarchaeobius amylolyticus]
MEQRPMNGLSGSMTYEIVSAISDREGCDIADLPPLYETIDPDALDTLTSHDVCIEFSYAGREVIVENGAVRIDPEPSSLD